MLVETGVPTVDLFTGRKHTATYDMGGKVTAWKMAPVEG